MTPRGWSPARPRAGRPPGEPATVSGLVVDAATGLPLAGAAFRRSGAGVIVIEAEHGDE